MSFEPEPLEILESTDDDFMTDGGYSQLLVIRRVKSIRGEVREGYSFAVQHRFQTGELTDLGVEEPWETRLTGPLELDRAVALAKGKSVFEQFWSEHKAGMERVLKERAAQTPPEQLLAAPKALPNRSPAARRALLLRLGVAAFLVLFGAHLAWDLYTMGNPPEGPFMFMFEVVFIVGGLPWVLFGRAWRASEEY